MYITGRIEIEKSRKKRIYWSNTHREYRIQRYTLTLQPARLSPKLSTRERKSRVIKITTIPSTKRLPSSPDFRIFKYAVVALQQIHSLLVSRVLAKYCLATKGTSRRDGGGPRKKKNRKKNKKQKQCRKLQCHKCTVGIILYRQCSVLLRNSFNFISLN